MAWRFFLSIEYRVIVAGFAGDTKTVTFLGFGFRGLGFLVGFFLLVPLGVLVRRGLVHPYVGFHSLSLVRRG